MDEQRVQDAMARMAAEDGPGELLCVPGRNIEKAIVVAYGELMRVIGGLEEIARVGDSQSVDGVPIVMLGPDGLRRVARSLVSIAENLQDVVFEE